MKRIKQFYNYNRILSLIAACSILISVLYIISYNLPEWDPGLGKLFEYIYNLCLAYLGSFIFYIVQVYIIEIRKNKKINSCIATPVWRIIHNAPFITKNLIVKIIGDTKDINQLTENDYKFIAKSIKLYDEAPMIFPDGSKANYLQYLFNFINIIEKLCEQVLKYTPFLETELISLIDNINNSTFHEAFNNFYDMSKQVELRNTDAEFLGSSMKPYCENILQLEKYAIKNELESKDFIHAK